MLPVGSQPPVESIPTLWFGMRCDFTRAAIEGAIARGGIQIATVVLPRGPKPLGEGWPAPPFDRWLHGLGVEVVEVDRLAGDDLAGILTMIEERHYALGVGACLSWKVPAAVRETLPGGVLNIHPALLPALRGPEPVFHAYRLGFTETGVTVHLMDAGWDSGPVLARERVSIPHTGRAEVFEADLARRGGRLLAGLAPGWLAGSVVATAQDDTGASWAPLPSAADRIIPDSLTVAQATRFLAACGPLLAPGEHGALILVDGPPLGDDRIADEGAFVRVQLADGSLVVRRATGAIESN